MVSALAATYGLAVVVGPAGAGKTAALAAAAQVWAEQGRPVRRGRGRRGHRAPARARHRHPGHLPDPAPRPRPGGPIRPPGDLPGCRAAGCWWWTRPRWSTPAPSPRCSPQTRAAGGTLVLVGDPAQLPEIGAGGLFAALARHPDTITLTDNRRQTEAWERRALADLRAGDPDAAVAAYAGHGRVHTAPADQLPDRVVADYLRLPRRHRLETRGRQRQVGRAGGDARASAAATSPT